MRQLKVWPDLFNLPLSQKGHINEYTDDIYWNGWDIITVCAKKWLEEN